MCCARPVRTHLAVDTPRLAEQSCEILSGGPGLGHLNRLQPLDGSHGANTTLDLDLSLVYSGLRDVCLGCMDPAEFRHAGKLSAADHHRLSGLGTHVDYLVTFSPWVVSPQVYEQRRVTRFS